MKLRQYGQCAIITLVAAIVASGAAAANTDWQSVHTAFQTSHVVLMPAGRATWTFALRERSGVILLNRLTVPLGVHAVAAAVIPHVADVRVTSWTNPVAPSPSCQATRGVQQCTQGEEWCPMPQSYVRAYLM